MSRSEKPRAFTFSLAAGILIIINALLLGVVSTWFPWIIPTIPGTSNDAVPFAGLTAIGLVCGALVLLGSLMLYGKPASKRAWGIIIIAFSIPSAIMGGGFIIGFILGIIGGSKAVKWKHETKEIKSV
jgi:hypothetical protein